MKKLILCSFLTIGVCKAQDAQFNNVNQSLVYLNPSYAGSEKCVRNQSNYRNQWPNLSRSMVTYNSCVDGYIKPIKGGIALSVLSDDIAQGTIRRIGAALSYAQYIHLSDQLTIIPSVQGSYNQNTLDKSRLNFGDVIDARYGILWPGSPMTNPWSTDIPGSRLTYYDVAAGLIVKHNEYWQVGASFANLMQPNIAHLGTYHLPVRTNVHALYKVFVNTVNAADVSVIATFQNNYYDARFNFINKRSRGLTYGLGYGINNNFRVIDPKTPDTHHTLRGFLGYSGRVFGIQYSYNRYLEFKYPGNSAGSHELSLEIKLKKKETSK
jgi:type IX secretion system PorP/SprF family membrane protein